MTVDTRPHLLSLEVLADSARYGAWSRGGIRQHTLAAGQVDVSDILLFSPEQPDVSDLDSVLSSALPGTEIARGTVGAYWEIYGLAEADSALPVSLELTPVGRSALRRMGESIGLTTRASSLNIRWREAPGLGGISSRSVVLDLSLVPRGRYELRVAVDPAGRVAAASSRIIEVR